MAGDDEATDPSPAISSNTQPTEVSYHIVGGPNYVGGHQWQRDPTGLGWIRSLGQTPVTTGFVQLSERNTQAAEQLVPLTPGRWGREEPKSPTHGQPTSGYLGVDAPMPDKE